MKFWNVILFVFLCFVLIYSQRECITAGRFPYPQTNCTRYMVCAWLNNNLVKSDWTCSRLTRFNPRAQKCVTNYACTDYICDPAFNNNVTDTDYSYADPNSPGGTTYIRCIDDPFGPNSDLNNPLVFKCPVGQVFVPEDPFNLLSPGKCMYV